MSEPVRWRPGVVLEEESARPAPDPEVLQAAREAGRAEARAELRIERERLVQLCASLHSLQRRSLDWLAAAALEVSQVVIEAWLEASDGDRRARLRPVLERWVQAIGADVIATAYVARADLEAWRDLIGELPISLQMDPALAAGDVRLRGERSMIELHWRERLAELRGELLAALPQMPAVERAAPPEPEGEWGATQRWRRFPP